MQRLIDANKTIHYQLYDDEFEEWQDEESTINEYVSRFTDEGEPETVLTIPDNPTNGDMQQAILPKHWKYGTNGEYVHVWGDGQSITFTLEWWNSPYKTQEREDNNVETI